MPVTAALATAAAAVRSTFESLQSPGTGEEVREGFECGLTLHNYSDIRTGDIVETFEMREKARS